MTMPANALKVRPRRRLPADFGSRPTSELAANLLYRQFETPAPNRKWAADFTYVWTAEGWLYVAVVIDLYSRRVVGWSMQDRMTARTHALRRPWQPAHERGLPTADGRARHHLLAVSRRQRTIDISAAREGRRVVIEVVSDGTPDLDQTQLWWFVADLKF